MGTVLGERYRLDSLLGEGGMGRVYAAEHVLMRKRVAVKLLHRELTTVPDVVARFEREAMAAANIDHPNVAAATDFGKLPDGSVYMVMEYVEGRNLRDEIAAGPMPPERATAIARQIAAALGNAHALSIVHRDLKPENVMLVAKGTDPDFAKVLDFGIARVPIGDPAVADSKPITRAGMVFGTPEYMAPEQALGQTVDGRADLYALGVMLYEMLAGVRPFIASSQTGVLGQQLSSRAPSFAERAPGLHVPPAIEQLVMRLIDREASARFQTAADVVTAMDVALGLVPGEAARLFTRIGGTSPAALEDGLFREASRPAPGDEGPHRDGSTEPAPPDEGAQLDLATAPLPLLQRAPGGLVPLLAAPPQVLRFVSDGLRAIDARSRRLPRPWSEIPAPIYVGAVAAPLLILTLVLTTTLRSRPADPAMTPVRTGSAASTSPPAASGAGSAAAADVAREVAAAVGSGSAALAELGRRHPASGQVQLALADAYVGEKRESEAVAALGRALEFDPSLSSAPAAERVLAGAVGHPEAGAAAFTLLGGPMGSSGAEIVFALATNGAVSQAVRQRADAMTRRPEFVDQASPALRVVLRLRAARTCAEVAAVLEVARTDGDARALRYLQGYLDTRGCKVKRRRTDCWPCLRDGDKLNRAIEAIAARSTPPAPPP